MTVVLVRHGESTFISEGRFQGRLDPPLSPLGERQAALVAQRLVERDAGSPLPIPRRAPSFIWHSPLTRAAQTARHIHAVQPAGVELQPLEALTEIAQGDWEGLPHSEVRARWPAELAAWRRTPATSHAPGGEPLTVAAQRVRGGLEQILRAFPLKSRSGPGSGETAAQAALERSPVPGYSSDSRGDPDPDPWAVVVAHDGIFRLLLLTVLELPIERFWSFPFNLCSISVVALNDGRAALRAHNLSEHLAPLADELRASAAAQGDRRGAL